jgi:transcriptional regulator with XRE-family HTH domain
LEKSLHSQYYEPVLRRLRKLRKSSGLTVRELAKRLKRDANLVWRLENRERRVDIVEFFWICKACGADPQKEAAGLMGQLDHLTPTAPDAKPSTGGRARIGKGRRQDK